MARRMVTVTDLLGRKHLDHNAYLDAIDSGTPEPWQIAAAREQGDFVPRVLLWGCGGWPLPGQSREPDGPEGDALGERPDGRPLKFAGPCVACGGSVRRGHYCLACDAPKGTLTARARAASRRRLAAADRKLRGGTG